MTDSQLDSIWNLIDDLMTVGDWWLLNNMFFVWTNPDCIIDLDIKLGIVTATLAGKSHLPNRKAFVDRCKELHPDPELWKGLD